MLAVRSMTICLPCCAALFGDGDFQHPLVAAADLRSTLSLSAPTEGAPPIAVFASIGFAAVPVSTRRRRCRRLWMSSWGKVCLRRENDLRSRWTACHRPAMLGRGRRKPAVLV